MSAPEARVDAYSEALRALLPRGLVHEVREGSRRDNLTRAIAAVAVGVEERASQLHEEADPRTTFELLLDWERVVGTPDECNLEWGTTAARRAAIVARFTDAGGQTPQHLVDVAEALGFTITVEEYRPFEGGISTGGEGGTLPDGSDYRTGWAVEGEDVHVFMIHGPIASPIFAECGVSACGDPLVDFDNEVLRCAMRRIKPAQTDVLFDLTGEWTGYAPWEDVFPDPAVAVLAAPPVEVSEEVT